MIVQWWDTKIAQSSAKAALTLASWFPPRQGFFMFIGKRKTQMEIKCKDCGCEIPYERCYSCCQDYEDNKLMRMPITTIPKTKQRTLALFLHDAKPTLGYILMRELHRCMKHDYGYTMIDQQRCMALHANEFENADKDKIEEAIQEIEKQAESLC